MIHIWPPNDMYRWICNWHSQVIIVDTYIHICILLFIIMCARPAFISSRCCHTINGLIGCQALTSSCWIIHIIRTWARKFSALSHQSYWCMLQVSIKLQFSYTLWVINSEAVNSYSCYPFEIMKQTLNGRLR